MSDAVQPDEITVPEKCPQCSKPGEQVDGTTVWHCDACGKTWDTAGDAVQPDEVTSTTALESRAGAERRQDQARDELNAATHEALMGVEPIPSRDQFLTMAATANMLSQSSAAPPAMRDPYVAFHVVMMGRALNLDPATAMNLIDAIGYDKNKKPEDQNIQLSLSPELLVARVAMMGLGSVELLWASKTKAAAVALFPGGKVIRATKTDGLVCIGDIVEIIGEKGRVEFDWDMAEEAELTDDRCVWDPETDVVTHWKKPGSNGRGWSNNSPNGCRCGSYKKHPGRMMGWRAMGFCVHTYFSQASLGLYSAEELGAAVDDNGRAIDPTTVDLPEGYESHRSAGTTSGPAEDVIEKAEPYMIDWLKARIAALPEEQRQTLKARWGEKFTEGRLPKFIDELSVRGANIAKALIAGQESIAKGAGWKPTVSTDEPTGPPEPGEADSAPSPQAPEAPQAPPGGPEPVSGGDPAPETVEDPGGAPEQPSSDATATPTIVFPTNEQLDQAIAYVGAMTEKQLNAGLRARTLDTKASERERRQALARVIANELAEEARAAEAE